MIPLLLCLAPITNLKAAKAVEQLTAVSATLSSTYKEDQGASNCIDGDTGRWPICHSDNGDWKDHHPWLALDFGKTIAIQRVEIFNRIDCCAERTKNVDVYVSDELPTSANQKFSGGSLLGTFLGPGLAGQKITISGEDVC